MAGQPASSGAHPSTMNTTTCTAPSPITSETRLGDLVVARPSLARLFEQLGLDYCCGGKQSLAEACARRSLDVATVIVMLNAGSSDRASTAGETDITRFSLTQLADHIEHTHHAYVKAQLPQLSEMADRVAYKHGARDARLAEVAAEVRGLTDEMLSHMHKEEAILFPLIRRIDAMAGQDLSGFATVLNPIRQMEHEHEDAGAALVRLRELTEDFAIPEDACNTHRALLAGLREFESDLFRHVHKENNALFPAVIALVSGAA